MVFDNRDFGVLMLLGLCRYIPSGISEYFDSPYFSPRQLLTLRNHKLIKLQSNRLSYSLTSDGRSVLEECGYSFPKDTKVDIQKESYFRKLKASRIQVTMFLAGIPVFYTHPLTLAGNPVGFVSSLILRSERDNRVLAGARLLGILKIGRIAYIPYHIENADEWILPGFERDTFSAQVTSMRCIKETRLLLSGKSLEELWTICHTLTDSVPASNGLKRFDIALKEMGCEYVLVPENRLGVLQLSVMKLAGYRKRLAKALGCDTENKGDFQMCDGVLDGIPYIIALDCNVKRIVRTLKHLEQIAPQTEPKICCLDFQAETMFALLERYHPQKTLFEILDENDIHTVFPETVIDTKPFEPIRGKEGIPVDANERKVKKDDIEISQSRANLTAV